VNSTTINLASGTFSGWVGQQISLVAGAATEYLWFFAVGTPAGQPPFALLDGVNVTVSEPSGAAVLGMGLLALMGARRMRHARK
jgi:MYXO-CTERM domain-containing protein